MPLGYLPGEQAVDSSLIPQEQSMNRTADARWEGDLRSGKGSMRLGSGAFEGTYSFGTRFEGAPGTNPEELIGAAHAGCFSMALSLGLTQAGTPPTSIATHATVHLDKVGEGLSITGIDLVTTGVVPGLSAADFQRHADEAKKNCIVSRALSVPITLQATLAGA
jgi:osmotically inducible protein OsmC